MAGFFRGLTQVVAVFTLATDVIWVYFAGGWGWTIASLLFFPITAIVAPFLALVIEPRDMMPLVLTVVFLVLIGISRIFGEAKEKGGNKARHGLDQMDRRALSHEATMLRNIYPVLDEMLAILDASRTVNGEVEMDYPRFTFLLHQARNDLGRLGISLPALNEGGSGATFHRALRRVAVCAREGDIPGARRVSMT